MPVAGGIGDLAARPYSERNSIANTAKGKEVDVDKKITLPKDQFIDDTDAEGPGLFPTDDDVEGHGKPAPEDFTVLPPPPGVGPGHGGELHDSGDDR